MSLSVKKRFLTKTEDDSGEGLITIHSTKYVPSKKQSAIHQSLARTRIVRGGLGSGKSRLACEHINAMALAYPGTMYVIARKDMTSLRDTTQKEFLENVVDPNTIETFNVNDNTLHYKNSSVVIFREAKSPAKSKSLQISGYILDEADELDNDEFWSFLDDRMRQKVDVDGKPFAPPFCGFLVFNPTDEQHWLYTLAHRTDLDIEDFQLSTFDNAQNLPDDYIPNLLTKLAPWDIQRLVYGNWGSAVKGRPVYHGFSRQTHVRPLSLIRDYPLMVSWDFGFNHPAVRFGQLDSLSGRYFILREFQGENVKLQDVDGKPGVVTQVKRIMKELWGDLPHPTFHYGDPHGADEKDTSVSSIEYLRVHHNIHVLHRREKISTGMDEIQHKIVTMAPYENKLTGEKIDMPLLVIDPSCKITITAYEGGYHRDEHGVPVKDGIYDHLPDTDRYLVVNTMNRHLMNRRPQKYYRPRNLYTGY